MRLVIRDVPAGFLCRYGHSLKAWTPADPDVISIALDPMPRAHPQDAAPARVVTLEVFEMQDARGHFRLMCPFSEADVRAMELAA
jgi:hypothetical protein